MQRTLSSTVHEYVEASYNASAPKKIRRSTSFQNVLRADEGMLSPLSRTGSRESVRSIDSGSRPGRGKSPLAKSRSKMSPALSRTSQSPPRSPLGSQEFSPKASSFAGSVAFGEDGMTRRSNADGSWTDSVSAVTLQTSLNHLLVRNDSVLQRVTNDIPVLPDTWDQLRIHIFTSTLN